MTRTAPALALVLALALAAAPAAARPALSLRGRAVRQGEAVLVLVAGNSDRRAPTASFRGRPLDFFHAASTGTWLALLGLDLEARTGPGTLRAVLRDPRGRAVRATLALSVAPGGFAVERLALARPFATPSKSDAERAEGELARVHGLFARATPKRLFEGSFSPPLPGAPSSRFGLRRILNGSPRAPRSVMDLRARRGAPVRAPAAGVVVLAGPLHFSGNTIVLDHGLGVTTLYAHLSRMLVAPGQAVRKGQVIGRVGATGRADGPRLSWGLRLGDARVDPFSLTALDLDELLKPRAPDPLRRSPACAAEGLPPAPPWGPARRGLRLRARALKAAYAPGEPVTMLVEIRNAGRRSAFLDFVRDPAARAAVLGLRRPPEPFSQLASSATARLATEQVKIPPGRTLCFEQDRDAGGPLLATETASYAPVYDTEFLYASSATVRAGIWRGRLTSRAAVVTVSTAAAPAAPEND